MKKKTKTQLVSDLIDKEIDNPGRKRGPDEASERAAAVATATAVAATSTGKMAADAADNNSSATAPGSASDDELADSPPDSNPAGMAWLQAAAGVGANMMEATAAKVSEVTKNISFASADSVRYTKLYDGFSKESGTMEINVIAGTVTQIPFFVPKGRGIVWKLLLKTLDVSFSVKLRVQELGGAVEYDLENERKVAAGEYVVGERKAIETDRHIVLFFDNRFSKLRAKTISYKVTIASPDIVAEVKDLYTKELEDLIAESTRVDGKGEGNTGSGTDSAQTGGASTNTGSAVGLVGSILSYSSSVISTAQTNAGILAQKAQENPRVNGALQFIQTRAGVLGSFWGKGKDAAVDTDDATGESTETGDTDDTDRPPFPPPPALPPGTAATPTTVGGGAAPTSVPAPAPAPGAEDRQDSQDDTFTDDAQAKFVMVDLNAPATANTQAP